MVDEDIALDVNLELDPWYLRVVDLKQFDYCRRVVYYQYCLPDLRPTTYKMEAGIAAQDRVEKLEVRRSLRAYGLEEGRRHFNVSLVAPTLGCTGQVDMVVEPEAGVGSEGATGIEAEVIPVDFKLSRKEPGRHFQLQLACYALMLEECWQKKVQRGFIYLIPVKWAVQVAMTPRLRNDARRKLVEMRAMILGQRVPAPTQQRAKCIECEFRRFCNDVI